MVSGTGSRSVNWGYSFGGGPVDTTHTVTVLPFLCAITLYRPIVTDNFVFGVTAVLLTANSYKVTYTIAGSCQLSYASQYRVIIDQTLAQNLETTYLDLAHFAVTNGVPPFSPVLANPTSPFAGITSFTLEANVRYIFSFDPSTLTVNTGNNNLNFKLVNLRVSSCGASTPYYLKSQNLCFDVCPSHYYTDTTNGFCGACYTTCEECSGPGSTQCTACNQYRVSQPNPGCPCLPGFYETAALSCIPCPIGQFCSTCAIVSCSTNANSINCLSCDCSRHRAISADGNCPCMTGYTATGTQAYCQPVWRTDNSTRLLVSIYPYSLDIDS